MRLVFSSIQIRTDTRNCSSFVPHCTRFVKSGSNITDTTTFDSIPRFFFAARRAILSLLPSSSYFSEKNIGRMRAACILFHRKKKKKSIGYAMLAIQLHFSLSSLHATFLHTPPVMLGWRGYCNMDSPRKIWKTSSPSPPFYDSCNRLIIARAFAKRWRMLRGFTSELAFI